jgi:hypothetical protein
VPRPTLLHRSLAKRQRLKLEIETRPCPSGRRYPALFAVSNLHPVELTTEDPDNDEADDNKEAAPVDYSAPYHQLHINLRHKASLGHPPSVDRPGRHAPGSSDLI